MCSVFTEVIGLSIICIAWRFKAGNARLVHGSFPVRMRIWHGCTKVLDPGARGNSRSVLEHGSTLACVLESTFGMMSAREPERMDYGGLIPWES